MQDVEFPEKYKEMNDEKLVELCQKGIQDAFSALAVRYILVIRNKAAGFKGVAVEAEDLFQEGLIGLNNAVRTYVPENGASFRTYAGVCIRNRIISAVRKAQSSGNVLNFNALPLSEQTDAYSADAQEPENAVLRGEQIREVMQYIEENLSDMEKRVLSLYLDGKTYDEISDILQVTKKSCDNAMQRVRKKLKLLK